MSDDIVAGDSTHAEASTYLRAVKPDDGPFDGTLIFYAGPGVGDSAPTENIDGICGEASHTATGAVGMGTTGVAGYAVSPTLTRDQAHVTAERTTAAGVMGVNTQGTSPTTPGVFGTGNPGVQGLSPGTGVLGKSTDFQGAGVHGTGPGLGVLGSAATGVRGTADSHPTERRLGVEGQSLDSPHGVGVYGYANQGLGGEFDSGVGTPLRLVPLPLGASYFPKDWTPTVLDVDVERGAPPLPLPKTARSGEIACLTLPLPAAVDPAQRPEVSLWLCVRSSTSNEPAHWQQLLTGPQYPGTAG